MGFPDGGTPGCKWGNWGLCGNFATNMNNYGGENVGTIRFMMPQLSGKMWGLCVWQSERRLGASFVFALLMKRFEKDLRVRTRSYA